MPSTRGPGDRPSSSPSAPAADEALSADGSVDADYAAAEDVGLPVAAVARRLGVAAGTLRTWDRRYGLGPSEHRAGAHRRYNRPDLERLVVMRRLTLEGVSPADAARAAMASSEDVLPSWSSRADDIPGARPGSQEGPGGEAGAPRPPVEPEQPEQPEQPEAGTDPLAERHRSQPPWGQDFDRAAVTLDPDHTTASVAGAFEQLGLVRGWEQLVAPTVLALSRRWATTGPGYDAELMLTSAVLSALRQRVSPEPSTSATALLVPAEDERDVLALHVMAAELADRGLPTQVLAPGRQRDAVVDALTSTRPAVVLVLATVPVREAEQLHALAGGSQGSDVVLAGPGWEGVGVPPDVRHRAVRSLADAVEVVAAAVLASAPAGRGDVPDGAPTVTG